jgi:hypothetical protein
MLRCLNRYIVSLPHVSEDHLGTIRLRKSLMTGDVFCLFVTELRTEWQPQHERMEEEARSVK